MTSNAHYLEQRVIERPEIGVDLFLEIPGQKPEALARFQSRARQNQALDAALVQKVRAESSREIGLASAGRPQAEHQFMLAHQIDIGGLRHVARPRSFA